MRPLQTIIIAALLTAASAVSAQAQPRHIYRDGQYLFCPDPSFDPMCREPNDYGPPVLVPTQGRFGPDLGAAAERAIRNALRPRYRKPPEMSMDEEREYIIRQGEEHCRKFPQDTQVCHPPRPQ